MRILRILLAPLALLAACTNLGVVDLPSGATSGFRVVNATSGVVTAFVDGEAIGTNLAAATVSTTFPVAAGAHTIQLQRSGAPGFPRAIAAPTGGTLTIVGLDSAGGITSAVLSDTNAIVPAGATKLRVAHMASLAGPISIWRTQPDFASPTRVQFPFPFRDVSPYLQSTPGDWRVMASSEDNTVGSVPMPDTLANSGLITIVDGTSRTVVLVDAPGGGLGILVVDP